MIDPMHGNTYKSSVSLKTRNYSDILQECLGCIEILKDNGETPIGIHLEASFQDVTEVIDQEITEEHLQECYSTLCDPRLNYTQTMKLLEEISSVL